MSDKLKEGLNELLSILIEALKNGQDFAVEQAPLVVQEFLNWGIATGIMQITLGLSLATATYFLSRHIHKNESEPKIGYMVIGVIGSLVSLIPFTHGVYDVVFILVAPRVYLIERISNFL